MVTYERINTVQKSDTITLTIQDLQEILYGYHHPKYRKVADYCLGKDGDPMYGFTCWYQTIVQDRQTKRLFEAEVTARWHSDSDISFDRKQYEFTEIEVPLTTKAERIKKVRRIRE